MPQTRDVRCTASDCEVDMVDIHFTYAMRDDLTLGDLQCLLCGTTVNLESKELSD